MAAHTMTDRHQFTLRVLGQLRLEVDSADPALLQRVEAFNTRRRALALLTMLALSPRPISRELLAAIFWGDSDPSRSRHSLAVALSTIRSLLGRDALETRTPDVSLSASAPLDVDVTAFRAALARHDSKAAVAAYTGDLLDGVFIDRAQRFDEWAALQRDELRAALITALAAECERLQAEGDQTAWAAVAHRWLRIEPLDTRAALTWFSALSASGSLEALLKARERYQAWREELMTEYELPPDSAVDAFMASIDARLRERREQAASSTPRVDSSRDASIDASVDSALAPGDSARNDTTFSSPSTPNPRGRLPVRRPRWTSGRARSTILVICLALLPLVSWRGGLWGTRYDRSVLGNGERPVTAVVADAEHVARDASLAGAVTLAMRTALTGGAALHVLSTDRVRELRRLSSPPDEALGAPSASDFLTDSMARTIAVRAGANVVVVPVLAGVGSRFLLAVRVFRAKDGRDLLTVRGEPVDSSGLLSSLNELSQEVRARFGASSREAGASSPLPDYTTSSLPALESLAAGNAAVDDQRYDSAAKAYRRAVAIDPGFAMAWSSLGELRAWSNYPISAESAFLQVERHLSRLTDRERAFALANMARWRGQGDSALAVRARWLDRHPQDYDMLSAQAYDLLQVGRYPEAAAALERILDVDSTSSELWINLGAAYRAQRAVPRRRAADAYARAARLNPAVLRDPVQMSQFGGILAEAGLMDSARAVLRGPADATSSLRGRALRGLGMLALWQETPDAAVPLLRDAIAASVDAHEPLSVMRSRLMLEYALRMAGDSAAAHAHRDTVSATLATITEPVALYWAGQRLARAGNVRGARAALSALEARMLTKNPVHQAARQLLSGELEIARGRADAGLTAIEAGARADSNAISRESLAYALWHSGRFEAARDVLRELSSSPPTFKFEYELARRAAGQMLVRVGMTGSPTRRGGRAPGYTLTEQRLGRR